MARKKKQQKRTVPQVGILFFFHDKLWIESTPLEKAGNYGSEFRIHDGDHIVYWDGLIREGLVTRHEEYQNIPRGRVVFNAATRRYRLMLDRCIPRQKNIVAMIKQQMGLPQNETDTVTDPHYRCAECLAESGLE
jgi:hypothetical protein